MTVTCSYQLSAHDWLQRGFMRQHKIKTIKTFIILEQCMGLGHNIKVKVSKLYLASNEQIYQ